MRARPPLRVLHAIHDFLPKHLAGSEIYASELCLALARRGHHLTVLTAAFDPSLTHGDVTWRSHAGLPVAEIINNWVCDSFEDTYQSPLMNRRVAQLLDAIQPDVVHVHNLLNLSFELPALAAERRIPVVATLHDYTLVCPSGGQRFHEKDAFVCRDIDVERCARCFSESAFGKQAQFGKVAARPLVGRAVSLAAVALRRVAGGPMMTMVSHTNGMRPTPLQIEGRLAAARRTFEGITAFVAPSKFLADEFVALGLPAARIEFSPYGFSSRPAPLRTPRGGRLRIGFVGTVVGHKGVHDLIEAVRRLDPARYELLVFGDAEMFPPYAQRLRESSRGLPIVFKGRFERSQKDEIYGQIDLLVVPSIWMENAPIVIQEAFMAGVPVLAARTGGIPDYIVHRENGLLFEPGDVGALAALLRECLDRPEMLDTLSSAAPPVKSIEQDADEWEARYDRVLSAGSV